LKHIKEIRQIKGSTSYDEIMKGIDLIINNMNIGEIVIIEDLTDKQKKKEFIVKYIKHLIDGNLNITFNSAYTKFKYHG